MAGESSIKVGKKAFLLSGGIVLLLMIVSGILTIALPSGTFERISDGGRTLVVNGSYQELPKGNYPFWRWFTAPVEILFGPENITPIVLCLFIIIVGGSIAVLEYAGVMEALIGFLVIRFAKKKYLLLAIIIFFFMFVSAFVAIYEGMIPMIIFIIPIAISLGWDSLTGLGMSLLPLAFGLAASVTNPFTVGLAQQIADLPMFSGSLLRILFFLVVYGGLSFFVIRYAKKVESNPAHSLCYAEDEGLRQKLRSGIGGVQDMTEKNKLKALIWFVVCISLAIFAVMLSSQLPGLSSLAFPVMGLFFLIGGLGGGAWAGIKAGAIGRSFGKGVRNMIPGIVLVLMAYSVKHIIVTGMIMDTILYMAAELIRQAPPMAAAFLVYAATLVMNFFIGSASAKAMLMMPLLTPLADIVGITRQTAVMAFDFGDGFSNMIFPTNPSLLIGLSFSVVGYTKWMHWTWKLQLGILLTTSAFLAFAVLIHFGPF
ncbi:MAG: hypothetical protein LBT16_08775 [Treponema sp.]|jgi:uncharacterized ion transporter superfamily protein YfcC|nr:hypothetical protein [Treponema sp.]